MPDVSLLIIIGIFIILFFIFRGIILWYWRINDLIKNQENQNDLLINQNDLLKKIFIQLGGTFDKVKPSHIKNEVSNIEIEDKEAVENLKKNIKKEELIIKVKYNGRIEKIKRKDWDEIIKIGNQEKFDLLFNND